REIEPLTLLPVTSAARDHGERGALRGRLDATDELTVEGVPGVQHDRADGAGAPQLQLPGGIVADVSELLDHRLDALAPVRGDDVRTVQDIGDGADRDARVTGDVLHADQTPFGHSPTLLGSSGSAPRARALEP